eukprot:364604-Chlamydomonas_euryale.AAC.3
MRVALDHCDMLEHVSRYARHAYLLALCAPPLVHRRNSFCMEHACRMSLRPSGMRVSPRKEAPDEQQLPVWHADVTAKRGSG